MPFKNSVSNYDKIIKIWTHKYIKIFVIFFYFIEMRYINLGLYSMAKTNLNITHKKFLTWSVIINNYKLVINNYKLVIINYILVIINYILVIINYKYLVYIILP